MPACTCRVVLVEGNYVLLSEEPWCQLRHIFDESWFVDVDIDVAMDRVYRYAQYRYFLRQCIADYSVAVLLFVWRLRSGNEYAMPRMLCSQ